MRKRAVNFTVPLACMLGMLLTVTSCSDKKKADRQAQMRAMLMGYFTVRQIPEMPISGLWTADQQSLANMIEKKYLTSYVAKPDEKKASEIRERLKSLKVHFRIQGRSVQMLTIVADSVGATAGELSEKPSGDPNLRLFHAQMRGKGGSLNAIFRLRKSKTEERLEYEEGGLTLMAIREIEKPEVLATRYLEQINAATGLSQY